MKNKGKIEKAIMDEGFSDMAKHPTLKSQSLVPILRSDETAKTEWVYCGNMAYNLCYYEKVNFAGFNNYEFIFMQVNKRIKGSQTYAPSHLKMFYKEKR